MKLHYGRVIRLLSSQNFLKSRCHGILPITSKTRNFSTPTISTTQTPEKISISITSPPNRPFPNIQTKTSRIEELHNLIVENGFPMFRFHQLLEGIFKGTGKKYSELETLPKDLRNKIIETVGDDILSLKPASVDNSTQATKVLFELHDGHKIEAVHMNFKKPKTKESGHSSLCISSQVGCALACNFCATGAVGFKRQLTVDEITDQILYFRKNHQEVHSISFMGMGEPLMNPRIFDAVEILTTEKLFNMSQRRLSISTVGIIPGIQKLTEKYPQVNLAFSLHSPFEEQRNILVPANKTHPLPQVMKVLERHAQVTGRKIFVAYLILDDFNDTEEHAKAVVNLINSLNPKVRYLFHLNLLRYNPAEGIADKYKKTEESNIKRFQKLLAESNVPSTIRASFGVDIDAACGQLFARYEQKVKKSFPSRNVGSQK